MNRLNLCAIADKIQPVKEKVDAMWNKLIQ